MAKIKLLPSPDRRERLVYYLRSHPKELILAVCVAIAASIMIYSLVVQSLVMGNLHKPVELKRHKKAFYSQLTGLEVTEKQSKRPITGVMIENSPDARPQSGLSQAGIVFETVAEGGITRYLALYQEARPKEIGPVRSLRPYYLNWATGFDANVAHAGGSGKALDLVAQRNAKSMNGLIHSDGYYRTGDRVAPHNLYTSAALLDKLAKKLGYYKEPKFKSYDFIRNDKPAAKITNKTIALNFSGGLYRAEFKYNRNRNSYLRYLAGSADKDSANGPQIAVKNVVVIPVPNRFAGGYSDINATGSGRFALYKNGVKFSGKWKKIGAGGQLQLLDKQGLPLELNAGQTWFAVVPQ